MGLCVRACVRVCVCAYCPHFRGALINIMNCFLLPKDVAKQLRDAEKAADEAAHDQLKAEREAMKQRRVALIAKWGLPEKAPTRIGWVGARSCVPKPVRQISTNPQIWN